MTMRSWRRQVSVLAMVVALAGCAAMRRREAKETGDLLVSAGFQVKPVDSPERAEQLRAMPPLKMVSHAKDGNMAYCYADPYSCQCLYVGGPNEYAAYRRLALQREMAEERLEAAQAEESAGVDWDLWGPRWW